MAFLQQSPPDADSAARAAGADVATTAPDGAVIAFDEVSKAFVLPRGHGQHELLALDRVSFTIRKNEFTTVVGPSGCGKSTLLRLVAGLTPPSGGRTIYKGHDVTALNTDVGVITQDSNLFPWLTMQENVEFPLVLRGLGERERRDRSREWIDLVGLTGFEHHYPYQLSGGMQKRAAIIRTMIYEPDVILMDEPFGPLDAQTRMLLQHDLLNIWQRDKKTILFITHDLDEAVLLSDRIMVLGVNPGGVRERTGFTVDTRSAVGHRPRTVSCVDPHPGPLPR